MDDAHTLGREPREQVSLAHRVLHYVKLLASTLAALVAVAKALGFL